MSEESNKAKEPVGSDRGKAPYVKPAFRYEKVFETMALSCGKVSLTQRQCSNYRKSS